MILPAGDTELQRCPPCALTYQHDGLNLVHTTTRLEICSGESLLPLPLEPALADAAATFRVTSDLACSLATDSQQAGKHVVNSVGDILRHEKLRRLEKVSAA